MKLEESIKLDEEDLFGKQKSISTEQSDLLKNLAYIENMIVEANDIIEARDTIDFNHPNIYYRISFLKKTM